MKIKITLVVLILIVLASLYLLIFSTIHKDNNYFLHLDRVNELISNEDNLPVKIHSLKIGTGVFPCWFQVAGECNSGAIEFRVFQLVYADGTNIIIDPVHEYEQHIEWPFNKEYDKNAYNKMQEALKTASKILITHEHFDHAGGVFRSPYFDQIKEKIVLNEKQYYSEALKDNFTKANTNKGINPVAYEKIHLIAPGVVLIDAEGHTKGNQIIFVKMKDSKKVMFIGDIVWNAQNFEVEKGRPKLASMLMAENSKNNNAQIKALLPFYLNNEIELIIAHDSERISNQIASGLIKDGLYK